MSTAHELKGIRGAERIAKGRKEERGCHEEVR